MDYLDSMKAMFSSSLRSRNTVLPSHVGSSTKKTTVQQWAKLECSKRKINKGGNYNKKDNKNNSVKRK
jgi:hypothetical protein